MSDFKTPKRITVDTSSKLEKYRFLTKDLYDNEEVCFLCGGLGIVPTKNSYGLTEDPDKSKMFPYMHEAFTFCPSCYNGIMRRCKLCGQIISKGYLKHNCKQQEEINEIERLKREKENLEKLPNATEDILKDNIYFYSESFSYNEGYFEDWDQFFDDWEANHNGEDIKPEYVRTTYPVNFNLDAQFLLENSFEHFELYELEDCVTDKAFKELQDMLDSWAKKNVSQQVYYPGKYKVKIPWELF